MMRFFKIRWSCTQTLLYCTQFNKCELGLTFRFEGCLNFSHIVTVKPLAANTGSMRGVGAMRLGRPSLAKMDVAINTANKSSYKNSQI